MKKIIEVTLVLLIFLVQVIYSQPKQKAEEVYLCKLDKDKIILDENYGFLDSNYNYDDRNNNIETLVNKYIGKNVQDGKFYFDKYQDKLSGFTKLKTGKEFYVSTYKKVFKSKVIGYQLWDNIPMGYEFNPVLENSISIKEDTAEYNNNLFLCSKFSNMSMINFKGIDDKDIIKKVTAFLYLYTDKLEYEQGYVGEGDHGETNVFEANFLNSEKKEYAVSYLKRIAFDKFASCIYIVSETGEIMKTVVEFKSEFNYYKLLGVVDYNGDGQYELLSESGYYEGIGYELYKNNEGKYEIIAAGFYWGV